MYCAIKRTVQKVSIKKPLYSQKILAVLSGINYCFKPLKKKGWGWFFFLVWNQRHFRVVKSLLTVYEEIFWYLIFGALNKWRRQFGGIDGVKFCWNLLTGRIKKLCNIPTYVMEGPLLWILICFANCQISTQVNGRSN